MATIAVLGMLQVAPAITVQQAKVGYTVDELTVLQQVTSQVVVAIVALKQLVASWVVLVVTGVLVMLELLTKEQKW
jgi:hypothetical protein